MAKVGFWLNGAKGKLAGATMYKDAQGDTVMRQIVSPSNPKTTAQMIQRIIMHTVMQAYSKMKEICDHSFEGVKKGQDCMSLFMKENVQKCRAAVAEMQTQGVAFINMYSFLPLGVKGFQPNQYLVSMGSLPQVLTQWNEETGGILYPHVKNVPNVNTYESIINSLGLQRGDQLTFCTVARNSVGGGTAQFNFARVILDPVDPDTHLQLPLTTAFVDAEGLVNMPSPRNEGSFKFTFDEHGLRFIYNDIYTVDEDTIAACVITSRKVGDLWCRSTTYMSYPGETQNSYSLGECLDMAASGTTSDIYTGADAYLNNAGQGGGQAANAGSQEQGGGSQGGGGADTSSFTISFARANTNTITVGTPLNLSLGEGEESMDVDVAVNFSDKGNVTAIRVINSTTNATVGNDHALSGNAATFTMQGVPEGTYAIKVVLSDDSVQATGYSFKVNPYDNHGGLSMD